MMFAPPPPKCPLCPRLAAFRAENEQGYPAFYNGAVPSFGELTAQLLIVGLAPGLKGANATGRPFTGDYAGEVLYHSLQQQGLAQGHYQRRADDGFALIDCRISNAVRCVPPENKPETIEIRTCNLFLADEIKSMPHLRVILSLGSISHKGVLMALGHKQSQFKFAHAAEHALTPSLILLNTYHSSRYNVNTGRLTQAMFDAVVARAKQLITI